MSAIRSDVEENGTQDAKVSDSGYSNSCRNSQSQRSTGSSKSRHSNSSGSSGYCGHQTALTTSSGCDSGSSQADGGGNGAKRKDSTENKTKTKTLISDQTLPETIEEQPQLPEPNPEPNNQDSTQGIDELMSCSRSPAGHSEALQIAALTQTLTCIKKLKHKDKTAEDTVEGRNVSSSNNSRQRIDDAAKPQDIINNCIPKESNNEEEMQIVVSMQDGVVLYTSNNLIDVLGYPKDMWVGRSLIDFVHPRHRIAFANHITTIIVSSQSDISGVGNRDTSIGKSAVFFCCLRLYRGLKTTGFSVTDKKVSYIPCQMIVNFREFQTNAHSSPTIFLVIATSPVRSAYKYPDECKVSPKFTIRHCSSTLMSHVDPEVVEYLGYLPQDLVGQSVLDFYHPEDLHLIKSTYNSVITEERQPVRSKPYRFRCQNGGFVILDTEWSAFVNPWSRKLEFMIGQHIVLKGPPFPDVTTPVEFEPLPIPEDIHNEAKIIEQEIKLLLSNTVGSNTESAKKQASKRCKDLATFMETFMDEIKKTPDHKPGHDIHMEDDKSFSERDSVMLGEISPHHEYYDSKSSSETPPSYNQLNYKENLQRFFESKPKTTLSDESATSGTCKELTHNTPLLHNNSESSGEGRGESFSCAGTSQSYSGNHSQSLVQPNLYTQTSQSSQSGQSNVQNVCHQSKKGFKQPLLTEQLLCKHNEDMEKQMVQKHREQRSRSSENKFKDKHKSIYDKNQEELSHGVKRSGSHSFEGEPFKVIKSSYESQSKDSRSHQNTHQSSQSVNQSLTQQTSLHSNAGHWTPFPVSDPQFNNNRPNMNTGLGGGPLSGGPLMPIYLIPPTAPDSLQQRTMQGSVNVSEAPPTSVFNPFILPQGMAVYQPLLVGATPGPVLYSPLTVLPAPVFPSHPPMKPPPPQPFTHGHHQNLSEQCKSVNTPRLTTDGESFGTRSNLYDDSSFYSSYESFANKQTDKSDESMKSSSENEKREMSWDRSHGNSLKNRPVKMVAPWMQQVTLTTELTLKYQLKEKELDEVLQSDLQALEKINQPSLVNDQLCQMYLDLELEGLPKSLTLEEGITSSSASDSSPDDPNLTKVRDKKKKKRFLEYEKMAILYEENAPFPPPISLSLTPLSGIS